ncbi:hypothetical protein Tco_0030990 [Tanacetum coccineum]
MLAVPPPSVYEVGGPSTTAVEGPSLPYSASRLPITATVIENLVLARLVTWIRAWQLCRGDSVPNGSCCRQIGSVLVFQEMSAENNADQQLTVGLWLPR